MKRRRAILGLMLLNGCGSCFEDRSVPEQRAATITTITITTEAGPTRTVLVGEGVGFAGLPERDASRR